MGRKGEMSALRRFRILLFVAVTVLLSVTIFSVTFSKWENPYKSVNAGGTVGTYYVNYGENETTEKVVRQVSASTSASGNSYVYENYVCVYRTYGSAATFAYVNFYVEGDDLSANVLEFAVTRTSVDSSGNPTSGKTDVSVYNSPVGKTLADINPVDGTDSYSGRPCKIGGTYIMVYFGSADKQYKALHITIKTDSAAQFTLKAEASNKDKETVYQKGFGKPITVYLGWEYEGTDFFDPSAASEMTGTCSTDEANIDGATIDVSVKVALDNMASIKPYRLTTGSIEEGVERLTSATKYFVPKNVVFNSSKLDCSFGENGKMNATNVIIQPKDGKLHTYKIKISGTVSSGNANLKLNGVEVADKKNWGFASGSQDRFIDTMEITVVDPAPEGKVWVHFNTNGGSEISDVAATKGEAYTPPTPTRSGYAFGGWYKDKALNTAFGTSAVVSSEITLYAKWNKLYEVAFNVNGGSAVASQSIASGSTATEPGEPTRSGYKFEGWYSDSALTQAFDFDTPITGNITLYAKWTAVSTDGLYANGTIVKEWTDNGDGQIKALSVTLTAQSTITVKYNNEVRNVKGSGYGKASTVVAQFSTNSVTLAAGTYDFWFATGTNKLWINGTSLAQPDSNSIVIMCKDGTVKISARNSGDYTYGYSDIKLANTFLHVYNASSNNKYTGEWKNGTFGNVFYALSYDVAKIDRIIISHDDGLEQRTISVSGVGDNDHITVDASGSGSVYAKTTL